MKQKLKKSLVVGIIALFIGLGIFPAVNPTIIREQGIKSSVAGENVLSQKQETMNVTCRICKPDGAQEITREIPIDEAIELQEKLHATVSIEETSLLLEKYGVLSNTSSLLQFKKDFQKMVARHTLDIKKFAESMQQEINLNDNIFYNFLCLMRADVLVKSIFFPPLFMFGTSMMTGWPNFPIWMFWAIVGLWEQIPVIMGIILSLSLISSTDLLDISIGGILEYRLHTVGLLGKRSLDSQPIDFLALLGFHGYHVTFVLPGRGGWDRSDTFIGFTLATIVIT